MLKLKLVYNDDSQDIFDYVNKKYSLCAELECYNYDDPKERKKAILVASYCGATKKPFISLFNNDKLIKALYSEVDECTLEKIDEEIRWYFQTHSLAGYIEIQKIDGKTNEYIGELWKGNIRYFCEGLSCYLSGLKHVFQTSNVIKIDWEENKFYTLNSIYQFKFIEKNGKSKCD